MGDEREQIRERRTPPTAEARRRRRITGLAVAGLTLAIVPFCPPMGLLGALLGVLSLRMIRRGGGTQRQRRLALGAIVAGAASALLWSIMLERWAESMQANMERDVAGFSERLLRTAMEGDAADVLVEWSDVKPSEQDVVEFGSTVQATFGDLERITLVRLEQRGSLMNPALSAGAVFHFSGGKTVGRLTVRRPVAQNVLLEQGATDESGNRAVLLRMEEVRIDLGERELPILRLSGDGLERASGEVEATDVAGDEAGS